jgi:hypothetical protein
VKWPKPPLAAPRLEAKTLFDAKSVLIGFPQSCSISFGAAPARNANNNWAYDIWKLIWINGPGKGCHHLSGQALRGETQMGILSWIILGLIAGFIGSKIVNRQGQGFWL